MNKNVRKIQQMMTGEFNKSSQVGYTPTSSTSLPAAPLAGLVQNDEGKGQKSI